MIARQVKWGWMLVAVLAALVGLSAVASAQCNSRQELERAATLIERARDEVGRSPVPEAKELLRASENRLRQGSDRANHGDHDNACRLALVSQQLAMKASEVARRGNRAVTELEDILARTEELLSDVAGAVDTAGPPEARRLFKLATSQQDEAKRAFRSDRLRLSLKLTLMARDTASRSLRLAEGRPPEDGRFVEKSLDETDRLISEATRVLEESGDADSGPGKDLLARARRLQHEGRRHFDGGRLPLALQLTRQARLFAIRALDQVDVDLNTGDVESMIEVTGELLDRLREAAVEAKDGQARDLLDRAGRLLADARAALQKDQPREALGSVRAASALALDVAERLGARVRN